MTAPRDHNFVETCVPAFMLWTVPDQVALASTDDPMWKWQEQRCALCGWDDGRVLDHDHYTGLTRGYLCRSCNVREGRSDLPVFALWRSGLNPARAFGWEEPYSSNFTIFEELARARRNRGESEDAMLDRIAEAVTR